MADGRHFEKTVGPILMIFGMAMHIRPSNLMGDQKLKKKLKI